MDRVLLVDGDDGFCQDMEQRLIRRGYCVSRAGTGLEGVQIVREGALELVFTQAGLSGRSGES